MPDIEFKIEHAKQSENVFYRVYIYDKWKEAKNKIEEITTIDQKRTNIYRGQGNSKWNLNTTIGRKLSSPNISHIENFILEKFKKGIDHYYKKQFKTNNYEYFEVMQHYGAPTRLLDCTSSPYIAAYFAFEKSYFEDPTENDFVSIWIIEGAWFSTQNLQIYNKDIDLLNESTTNLWIFKDYTVVDKLIKQNTYGIIPIIPSTMDDRMLAQQSIFLLPTSIDIPFEKILESYYSDLNDKEIPPISRIDISINDRLEAIKDLNLMNINPRTIYPGIEGYTKAFIWEYELYVE